MKIAMKMLNPFRNLSTSELVCAYEMYTDLNDSEAIEWVVETFCDKAKIYVDFDN
jgi:hypothetical protein